MSQHTGLYIFIHDNTARNDLRGCLHIHNITGKQVKLTENHDQPVYEPANTSICARLCIGWLSFSFIPTGCVIHIWSSEPCQSASNIHTLSVIIKAAILDDGTLVSKNWSVGQKQA